MHVVIAIIQNPQKKILIAQRPKDKYKGGLWEFPGGKVELNETPFNALQRELQEELNIQTLNATPWLQVEYDYADRKVLLDAWLIHQFSGEPIGAEGQPIRWILPSEFEQYEFPAGNRLIIEKLCLKP